MNYRFILPGMLMVLVGCINNNKNQVSAAATVSVNKVWAFKNIDTARAPNKQGPAWIGSNLLDLTNKDTLKFSYSSTHNKPTFYPYHILHDTIFILNKPAYKILKLTQTQLCLVTAFISRPKQDSVVMIYEAK